MIAIASDRRAAGKRRQEAASGLFLLLALMLTILAIRPETARAEISPFTDARRICRTLLPAFAEQPIGLIREPERWLGDGRTVIVYQWTGDRLDGADQAGWLACWFLPMKDTGGFWQIDHLETSKYGVMTRYDVQQLYKLLRMDRDRATATIEGGEFNLGYLVQQTINALALGCLYALIAVAFSLIYAAGRFINFAFGPLITMGAFMLLTTGGIVGSASFGPALSFALAMAAIAIPSAVFGWTMYAGIFRRLAQRPLAAMIAAIGLAIALREAMRLLHGPATQWLPFQPDAMLNLGAIDGFTVVASVRHMFIGIAAGLLALALYVAGKRTRWGRAFRASVQDRGMAALLGVDGPRLIACAFLIGGMLAGLAGAFAAWHYGPVDFRMGTPLGFKALTAAVVGGLGSIPGAFLGGITVAAVETIAGAAIGGAWRDVIVFGLLAGMLVLRPGGLTGDRP
jgi:branched-chain amino acid transport system permease protein